MEACDWLDIQTVSQSVKLHRDFKNNNNDNNNNDDDGTKWPACKKG